MDKPEAFQQPYTAAQNIPYLCGDSSNHTSFSSGGVLGRGQVVWLHTPLKSKARSSEASAFVDGIGLVSLNPRWLISS